MVVRPPWRAQDGCCKNMVTLADFSDTPLMVTCMRCNQVLQDGDRFCRFCGQDQFDVDPLAVKPGTDIVDVTQPASALDVPQAAVAPVRKKRPKWRQPPDVDEDDPPALRRAAGGAFVPGRWVIGIAVAMLVVLGASLLYDLYRSQLDDATRRVELSSALSQVENQVTYTNLVSDRPGIVTTINADVGQVVGSGTPVATVAVEGEKEVQVAVPETEIANFKTGLPVKVGLWSDTGLSLDGTVREVAGSADPQSRTFSVRVSLPNDPRVLLGMTATVEASAGNGKPYVSVPLSALAQKDGYTIVWVVDRGTETVSSRPVTLSDFTADGVRVTDGLEVGDLVVAAGTQFMADDLKVTISNATTQHSASAQAEVPLLR